MALIDHRRFLVVLLISLLLHFALGFALRLEGRLPGSRAVSINPARTSGLSFSLEASPAARTRSGAKTGAAPPLPESHRNSQNPAAHDSAAARSSSRSPSEQRQSAVTQRAQPNAATTGSSPARSVGREALDLSLPAAEAPPGASLGAAASARVFDPNLRNRLTQQRQHSARARRTRTSSDSAEFAGYQGGRAMSRLRMGGLCFEVLEADPLDPMIGEQWYSVACE